MLSQAVTKVRAVGTAERVQWQERLNRIVTGRLHRLGLLRRLARSSLLCDR